MGFLAPRYHLRTLLLACAFLMISSGLAIPAFRHLVFIAVTVFIGTLNPSIGDIGVHVPLEHAALAQMASDQERTRAFARYSLVGGLSIAAGTPAAGAPELLASWGISKLTAFQMMFYAYAALGLLAAALYSRLSATRSAEEKPQAPLGESRRTVYKLAALFCIVSFAGGFTVQSLLALWLFQQFDMSLAAAGAFFFWSNMLSAFSYPVAARL